MTGSKRGDALVVLIMSQLRKSFPNKVSNIDYMRSIRERYMFALLSATQAALGDIFIVSLPVCALAIFSFVCVIASRGKAGTVRGVKGARPQRREPPPRRLRRHGP